MIEGFPLTLFNSLTRQPEPFRPVHEGEARVYTCGPTVYNYPHIGNMRAYVFADVLGRTLSHKGYKLTHVINITDVGHLTDDADAGEDKLEKAARANAQSIWDIARHYTEAYWGDIRALNIRQPAQWSIATEYVSAMIEFAQGIADRHCYELDSGLYFDVSTVADYGRLARDDDLYAELQKLGSALSNLRGVSDHEEVNRGIKDAAVDFLRVLRQFYARKSLKKYSDLITLWDWLDGETSPYINLRLYRTLQETRRRVREGRIEAIEGKRNDEDFAIWRKTPPGEARQMEWDSPWGRGAPGWHLECSVMSGALLGFPFDIHTGGIDHREIHHPNEIAQNQAHCHTNGLDIASNSGANIWMHNNFLVERGGKMSKSSGEFLRLQLLIDKGYHPIAYRLMCLQAHYRSELEFSWENLAAALTRLKRMVMAAGRLDAVPRGDANHPKLAPALSAFDAAISDDLNTSLALTAFEDVLAAKKVDPSAKRAAIEAMDAVLGLGLLDLTRNDLRLRPASATLSERDIENTLNLRRDARAAREFATSDALRDELAAQGVEVMDGDPLGWEWKLTE